MTRQDAHQRERDRCHDHQRDREALEPADHDHIIRDGFAFERIQNYIANNPSNWKEDTFHVGKYLNGNRNDNTVR